MEMKRERELEHTLQTARCLLKPGDVGIVSPKGSSDGSVEKAWAPECG